MRVGLAQAGRLQTRVMICPTPRSWSQTQKKLLVSAQSLTRGRRIHEVVGAFPGIIRSDHRGCTVIPARWAWAKEDLGSDIRRLFRAPVFLENDAVLAGLGEARRGAGKKHRVVAYVAFGTGVGGARIVDGKLPVVHQGFEPGHHFLSSGRTWSQAVGGMQLERKYKRTWPRVSASAWARIQKDIAAGLVNVILFWAPDAIVLGGSIVLKGKISLRQLRRTIRRNIRVVPSIPPIVRAQTGEIAGLVGAASISIARRV